MATQTTTVQGDEQTTLRARAEDLARRRQTVATVGGGGLFVVQFALGAETYAVEGACVGEVLRLKELTRLPGAPSFVLGVINLRGRILSVVDLREFFGLARVGLTDATRAIVLRHGALEFAVVADAVLATATLQPADLEPAPPTLAGLGADCVRGVTAQRVIVLDAAGILADPRLIVNDQGPAPAAARSGGTP